MPKKIKVVDVVSEDVKNEEPEPSVNEEEVNDITTVDAVAINEEPLPDIEDTPKPKAKPKAKPRTKKAPMEVILETKEETTKSGETQILPQIKEEPKTDKNKKFIELVKCPKRDEFKISEIYT